MSEFEKLKAKHEKLIEERKKKSDRFNYPLDRLYADVSKSKRECIDGHINHTLALEILFDAQLELIRLFKESLK